MTESRHFCDRCGVRILADRSALAFLAGPLRVRHGDNADLCAGCAELLQTWLASGREASEPAPGGES